MTKRGFATLGLMVICALAIVTYTLLFLHPSPGDGGVELTVRFQNIDKISKGTRVMFAGKPVGEVKKIHFLLQDTHQREATPGPIYPYQLTLAIDSSVMVYQSDEIAIHTMGLMGERFIAIIPKATMPEEQLVVALPTDILFAKPPGSVEGAYQEISDVIKKADQTISLLASLIEKNQEGIYHTTQALTGASAQLEALLKTCNEEQLGHSLPQFTRSAQEVCTHWSDIAHKLETSHIIENMQEASQHLISCAQSINQPEKISSFINQLPNLASIEAKAHTTLQSVEKTSEAMHDLAITTLPIVKTIHQKEGSLGRFIYDPSMYNTMNRLVSDMQNYGLLFHWNSAWKQEQYARHTDPCDHLHQAIGSLQSAIDTSQEALTAKKSQINTAQLATTLQLLQEQIHALQNQIQEQEQEPLLTN